MTYRVALVILALTGGLLGCGGKGGPENPLSPSATPPVDTGRSQIAFIRGPWGINAYEPNTVGSMAGVGGVIASGSMPSEGVMEFEVTLAGTGSEEMRLAAIIYRSEGDQLYFTGNRIPVEFTISKTATVRVPYSGLESGNTYEATILNRTPGKQAVGDYAVIYYLR